MAKKKKYEVKDDTKKSIADLLGKSYGDRPLGYEGTFKQAYENLGQPYQTTVSGPGGTATQSGGSEGQQNVAITGTRQLAEAFATRYFEKYGKVPDEDTTKGFVGQNLNSRYAQEVITGLPMDQLVAKYVDPYIQANANDIAPETTESETPEEDLLQRQLGQYYDQARTGLASQVEDAYNPAKQKMVNELAAQGNLSSAASRYSLNELEGEKNRSLTQAFGGLAEKQASGQLGVASTLAGLRQDADQFGRTLGLERQKFMEDQNRYDTEMGLKRQELSLADRVGRAQADASKPGTLDYLNTGINMAGLVAPPFTAGKSIGLANAIGTLKPMYGNKKKGTVDSVTETGYGWKV